MTEEEPRRRLPGVALGAAPASPLGLGADVVYTREGRSLGQRAIDLGLRPVTAYQMASLNPAEHFGPDGEVGGIAPGRWADFIVLPDLRTVCPDAVVARGRLVAHEGRCLVPCPEVPLPAGLYPGRRPGPLDPSSLRLERQATAPPSA